MERIIRNLSNDEYHHGEDYKEYVSSSQLKTYLKSPKAFRYALDKPQEQTEAMRFGSLFHDLMSSLAETHGVWEKGCETWLEKIAVFKAPINEKTGVPYGAATKVYKEAYEQFLTENEGKTIASIAESDLAKEMAHALLYDCGSTSEQVYKLLKWAKESEVSYFYEDENGIKLKVRPDMLTSNKVIDWKSCALDSLDEKSIAKQIIKYRYDVSLSMYQFCLHKITGKWYKPYLVFVSKIAPYECVICDISDWCYYFTDDEDPIVGMGIGAMEFQRLYNLHTECTKKNEWEGVESTIKEKDHVMKPSIPAWFGREYDEEY